MFFNIYFANEIYYDIKKSKDVVPQYSFAAEFFVYFIYVRGAIIFFEPAEIV